MNSPEVNILMEPILMHHVNEVETIEHDMQSCMAAQVALARHDIATNFHIC